MRKLKRLLQKPRDRTSPANQSIPSEPQERPRENTTVVEPEVFKFDSPWKEAYERLAESDPKLIHAYENGLLQAWQPEETGDIVEEDFVSKLIPLIKNRLEVINQSRAKIVIGNKDIVVREKLGQVVDLVISAKDLISAAISPEPHAAIAWAGVLLVLGPVVKAFKQEDEAVEGFTQISHILVRYRVLESEIFPDNRNAEISLTGPRRELVKNIRDQTIELYTAVLGYQIRLATHFSKSGLWRAFDDLGGSDDWKSKLQEIKEIYQRIQAGLTDNDRVVVDNRLGELQANLQKGLKLLATTEDVAQRNFRTTLLSTLQISHEAAFNFSTTQDLQFCLENTQTKPLGLIQEWLQNPDEDCLYWLQGFPGTGKSTISRTVAQACYSCTPLTQGASELNDIRLGGSFFFDHQKPSQNNANLLFTTICSQLIENLPEAGSIFYDSLSKYKNLIGRPFDEQWDHLVIQPLTHFSKQNLTPLTVVLVLDALDECLEKHVDAFLPVLTEPHALDTICLKIFTTSRPESHIHRLIGKMKNSPVRISELHKVDPVNDDIKQESEDDITRVLKHGFSRIVENHEDLSPGWPGDDQIRDLAKKAEGLFIHAATVCRFLDVSTLDGYLIEERLQMIIRDDEADSSPRGSLDAIYSRVLSVMTKGVANERESQIILRQFRLVVGAIILVFEPPTMEVLSTLINLTKVRCQGTLKALHSVLSVNSDTNTTIQLLHLSFRDYLLDEERSKAFHVSRVEVHGVLFENCLNILEKNLERDMCKLSDPSTLASDIAPQRVDEHVSPQTLYAAKFWVNHLRSAEYQPLDHDAVHQLLEKCLLHWLELGSISNSMTDIIMAILNLSEYLNTLPASGRKKLRVFVYDMKRFAIKFRGVIETAPLQVYHSAILYSPANSQIFEKFKYHLPNSITRLPATDSEWGPLLQTLPCAIMVTSVAISSNGKLILTASDKVRLWDAETGALIKQHNYRADDSANNFSAAVSFSSDEFDIIAISDEGCLWVWNVASGLLARRAEGEIYWSNGEMPLFSGDKRFVALAGGSTFQLVNTEEATFNRLEYIGKEEQNWALAFTPNGNILASKLDYDLIKLWETKGCTLEGQLTCLCGDVLGLEFSPDGSELLSWGQTGLINLWNLETRQNILQVQSNYGFFVNSANPLCYTPEVTRGTNLDVFSWDWTDRKMLKKLHLKSPFDVKRSMHSNREGLRAFFGPGNNSSIAVHDTGSPGSDHFLSGHADAVLTVAFSSDGRLLVSGSIDATVRLWDLNASSPTANTNCHLYSIKAILTRTEHAVVTFCGEEVGIWDSKTGYWRRKIKFRGYGGDVSHLSTTGDLLAVVNSEMRGGATIDIWNTSTCLRVQKLSHIPPKGVIDVSACQNLLAYGVGFEQLKWFCPDEPCQFLDEKSEYSQPSQHEIPSDNFTEAQDNTEVSLSQDKIPLVRIWSISTGGILHTLRICQKNICDLKFSPDGNILAIVSYSFSHHEAVFEVWTVKKGRLIASHAFYTRHNASKKSISWSSDSMNVAFTDNLRVIFLWRFLTEDRPVCFKSLALLKALAFSPSGQTLASLDEYGVIQLWRAGSATNNDEQSFASWSPPRLHQTDLSSLKYPQLEFSEDGKAIHTNFGRIDIRSFDHEVNDSDDLSLYIKEDWIYRGRRKVLLIPHEYRANCAVAVDETLVMGVETGTLISLNLDRV